MNDEPGAIEIAKEERVKPERQPSERAERFWMRWAETGFDPAQKLDIAQEVGYSQGSLASGVKSAITALTGNEKMQEALRNQGVDLAALAKKLKELLDAKRPVFNRGGNQMEMLPDNSAQLRAFELAAKIADAFPSQKIDIMDRKQIVVHITQETVTRGIQAADAKVVEIDATESEFLE